MMDPYFVVVVHQRGYLPFLLSDEKYHMPTIFDTARDAENAAATVRKAPSRTPTEATVVELRDDRSQIFTAPGL